MNDVLLNNNKERMILNIERLFQRIQDNKETLRMDLVEEDLKKLHLEIARTTSRMGL